MLISAESTGRDAYWLSGSNSLLARFDWYNPPEWKGSGTKRGLEHCLLILPVERQLAAAVHQHLQIDAGGRRVRPLFDRWPLN